MFKRNYRKISKNETDSSTPELIPVIRSLLLYITDSIKQFYLTRML